MADDPVAQMNAGLEQLVPVAFRMGVRFTDMRPGSVAARVPFEGNGNHFGAMYAGAIFTVAEVLGGALHFATFDVTTHYPLVREMSVEFVAPGKTDLVATLTLTDGEVERIRTEARPDAKVNFTAAAEVVDAAGELVARTTGAYQLRPFGR